MRSYLPSRNDFRILAHRPWRLAAVFLIAALFASNIYRAATQSIAHDEGVIFEWLLSGPWSQVLGFEHGNHHVLSDLACKLMLNVFGPSPIAYRIPALLGGLLYFYSVFRMSGLLFGEGLLSLLAVASMSLNPFVLDYLACARGYGPALGFFFYALYQVIAYLADAGPGRRLALNKAGVGLGLSIGSNIIMIFPGAALVLAAFALLAGEWRPRRPVSPAAEPPAQKARGKKEKKRKPRDVASEAGERRWSIEQAFLQFALPAAVIGGFLSMLPKRLIELEAGYMGPPSLAGIAQGLVRYSFFHSPSGFGGLLAAVPVDGFVRSVADIAVPAGLLAIVIAGVQILRHWLAGRDFDTLTVLDRALLLEAVMLPAIVGLVVVSRYGFEEPYPELRTAMYFVPLFTLGCMGVTARLAAGAKTARMMAIPAAAAAALCVVQFVTQFNTRYFAEWSYCAAGKDMMARVVADHARTPGARARIGATWQLEPVINFYRVAWRLDWLDPVYRESPDGSYDYYLLAYGDTALVGTRHLQLLEQDRLAGTVLAKRPGL